MKGYSIQQWGKVVPTAGVCTCLRNELVAVMQVKEYLERQWGKILANRVSVQDFVFAKEVRLGTYSPKAAVVPPAAIVAAKAMATDPRAEPRFAERVPYVVVYGEPGQHWSCLQQSRHCQAIMHLALGAIYSPVWRLARWTQVLLHPCLGVSLKHADYFGLLVLLCKL